MEQNVCLTFKALIFFYENHGNQKVFFQFEIIINVFVSSSRYGSTAIERFLILQCGDRL